MQHGRSLVLVPVLAGSLLASCVSHERAPLATELTCDQCHSQIREACGSGRRMHCSSHAVQFHAGPICADETSIF